VLEKRGDVPRLKRNRLVFLAPDGDAVQRLRDAARTWLAWKSIVDDVLNRRMDLGTYQADQARRAMDGADDSLKQMVRETWRWLMVPTEEMARGKLTLRWEAVALSASAPSLVEAIESKLKEEEWLVSTWSPVHLNRVLNQWYFKDGVTEVSALKVWQDSCQYLYLPRLLNADVFVQAVTAGCSRREGFAFASGRDETGLLGFTFGQPSLVTLDSDSLLVSHEAALAQAAGAGCGRKCPTGGRGALRRRAAPQARIPLGLSGGRGPAVACQWCAFAQAQGAALPNRFYGTVEIDPDRASLDFSTVVSEVIQHFTTQTGVLVKVTVEIEASHPPGFEAALQRAVKENCGVLRFRGGFRAGVGREPVRPGNASGADRAESAVEMRLSLVSIFIAACDHPTLGTVAKKTKKSR
jgi:hypothetical protein